MIQFLLKLNLGGMAMNERDLIDCKVTDVKTEWVETNTGSIRKLVYIEFDRKIRLHFSVKECPDTEYAVVS